MATQADRPLIFISHDTRDAQLAEAFELLLSDISAGTIEVFRSSAFSGSTMIAFGEEWLQSLIAKLEASSDVVALLTERSMNRPWILFEAGLAKGKLGRNAIGVALGVPLKKEDLGPFAALRNCPNEEDALTSLLLDIVKRNVPQANPPIENVRKRVRRFIREVEKILSAGTCTQLNDSQFLDYMADTIPLKGQEECKAKFAASRNPLVKFFVKYHLQTYDHAILQATRNQILPLPSVPRMDVAKAAIETAKEVRAVSIFSRDQWSKYDLSYIAANVAAAHRGAKIRRVVILDGQMQRQQLEQVDFISRQLDVEIELRWGLRDEIKERLSRAHSRDINLVNVLITSHDPDEKRTPDGALLLSRSYGDANHDGEVVLNSHEIGDEVQRFEQLWDIVQENVL